MIVSLASVTFGCHCVYIITLSATQTAVPAITSARCPLKCGSPRQRKNLTRELNNLDVHRVSEGRGLRVIKNMN